MASSIKHDSSGFLIGELITTTQSVLDAQGAGVTVLRGIRHDVAAIARAMGVKSRSGTAYRQGGSVSQPAGRSGGVGGRPGVSNGDAARSRAASNAMAPSAPVGRAALKRSAREYALAQAVVNRRDSRGRFVAGGRAGGGGTGAGGSGGGDGGGYLDQKLSKMADAMSTMANGSENMDPALTAMSEVKSVLAPLGRGLFSVFGRSGEQKKERWYKKLLAALTKKKPDTVVVAGSSGDGGSGIMAGIGAGMAPFLVKAGAALLAAISLWGAALLAGVAGWKIGTVIKQWMDDTGVTAKMLDFFEGYGKKIKDGVKDVVAQYDAGKQASKGLNGPLDASGRQINDQRLRDMNDPGAPKNLNEWVANAAGRVVGGVQRGQEWMAGEGGKVVARRGGVNFAGIKGGDSLTKNGTYTPDEAERIRALKTSGANTGAFGKGGMSAEIAAKIEAQARANGLDPILMKKIVAMESGGNPNAISSTGAIGLMQFTGKTATGVGVKDRFNEDQNIAGGMRLTKENMARLQKSGLPVNAENLYMMHQLGPRAAEEVIRGAQSGADKASLSPATQKAMNFNYGAKSATAADYIATNKTALDARYNAAATNSPAMVASPSIASPVPLKLPGTPEATMPPQAAAEKPQPIIVKTDDVVGQNVKDRAIAHVATGGLGAGGW